MEARSAALVVMSSFWAASTAGSLPTSLPGTGFTAKGPSQRFEKPDKNPKEWRRDALARADVWRNPPVPIERADLRNGPGPVRALADEAICKFHPHKTGGATAKFDCVFEGGEVL